jgi:Cu+-exporting ATPase
VAIGFSASEETSNGTTLSVQGMHCGHCTAKVEAALASISGVGAVSVDLAAGTATIQGVSPSDVAALVQAVEQAGFKASLLGPAGAASAPKHDPQTMSSDNAAMAAPTAAAAVADSPSGGEGSFFPDTPKAGSGEERAGELTPVFAPSHADSRSSRTRLLTAGAALSSGGKPRGARGRRVGGGDGAAGGLAREVPQEIGASVMLGVSGMTCDSCRVGVERCLSAQVSRRTFLLCRGKGGVGAQKGAGETAAHNLIGGRVQGGAGGAVPQFAAETDAAYSCLDAHASLP